MGARHVDFEEKDAAIDEYLNLFGCFERSRFSPMKLFNLIFGSGRSTRKDEEKTP